MEHRTFTLALTPESTRYPDNDSGRSSDLSLPFRTSSRRFTPVTHFVRVQRESQQRVLLPVFTVFPIKHPFLWVKGTRPIGRKDRQINKPGKEITELISFPGFLSERNDSDSFVLPLSLFQIEPGQRQHHDAVDMFGRPADCHIHPQVYDDVIDV